MLKFNTGGGAVSEPAETITSSKNLQILQSMMGDAYLDEGEIKILCNRKLSQINRGLSSNEIISYLFLKLHSTNGWIKSFANSELLDYVGMSKRDTYYVLETLKKVHLINFKRIGGSCYKDVHIYHSGPLKKHTRFLSLNRTYFRDGTDDFDAFKSLSAGEKSTLLYLLFREKFQRRENGEVLPKTYGNIIEVWIEDIIKITGVERDTVILYIQNINEKMHNLLNVEKALYGTLNDRRMARINDKRLIYGAVTSPASRKWLTIVENDALGFWRSFERWLKSHGYKERPLPSSTKREIDASAMSFQDRIQNNRKNLFTGVQMLLKENVSWQSIYSTFLQLIKPIGTFDEYVVAFLIARLKPRQPLSEVLGEPTG